MVPRRIHKSIQGLKALTQEILKALVTELFQPYVPYSTFRQDPSPQATKCLARCPLLIGYIGRTSTPITTFGNLGFEYWPA